MPPYQKIGVIVGFPRSGTTLLRSMLAKNPQLDVLEVETHYLLDMHRAFGAQLTDPTPAIRFLVDHRKFPGGYTDKETVRQALEDAKPGTLSALLNQYFRIVFPTSNCTLVIKHPALVSHLDVVSQLLPNSVVINTIRDPRAAIASHRARWPTKSVAEVSVSWRKAVESAARWRDANPERYVDVRYEQLLQEPVSVLQSVSSLLGVDNAPEMLTIDFDQAQWDLTEPGSQYRRRFESLDTKKIDEWRSKLSSIDVALIEASCRKHMIQQGYELLRPPLDRGQMALYHWKRLEGRSLALARDLKWRLLPA